MLGAFPVLGLFVVGQVLLQEGRDDLGVSLIIGFTVLAALLFGWAMLSVRCPRCGVRLLWKAAREHSPGEWLRWLGELRRCPACEY
jgi:hypothetical protein